MKRLAEFAKSLLPADRAQLFFLSGLVCLTVAPRMRWLPSSESLGVFLRGPSADALSVLISVLIITMLPILLSAFAGYWIVFWPGQRPARRIFLCVLLPTLAALGVICGFWLYLTAAVPISIFDKGRVWQRGVSQGFAALGALGPGFHACLIGVLLVAIFLGALMRGRTSLLVTLHQKSLPAVDGGSWKRVQRLTWVLVGPQALAFSALTFTVYSALLRIAPNSRAYFHLGSIIELAVLVFAAAFCLGREGMRAAWRLVRLPTPHFALLGAIIPVLASAPVLLAAYVLQRAGWVAQNHGRFGPPTFFPDGVHFDPLWLLLILAAFGEELAFRGILQQQFVERYGLFRGVALVGIVWSAFHFPGDHYSGISDVLAVEQMFLRIAACLAMGFALSWLTLRSGTVLPATLAHALSNMLVYAGFYGVPFGEILRIASWGLLAFLLFKRFPSHEQLMTTGKDTALETAAAVEGITDI